MLNAFALTERSSPARAVRVLLLGARVDVVAVVLHHEHDRELPQRGDVQRLEERALLRRAVAEEAEHHLALAADLRAPRRRRSRAGCRRPTMPDVPRKPFETSVEVHRAADALADPVLAAVDLRHHRLRVGAARDRVAVAAVGREELVVGAEGRDRADDRRLGAVGEVRVTADHARVLVERALDALLELADPQHLLEHPDQPVAVELLDSFRCAHAELLSCSNWLAVVS